MSADTWHLIGSAAGAGLFAGMAAWILELRALRSLTREERQNRDLRRERLRESRSCGGALFVGVWAAVGSGLGRFLAETWVR